MKTGTLRFSAKHPSLLSLESQISISATTQVLLSKLQFDIGTPPSFEMGGDKSDLALLSHGFITNSLRLELALLVMSTRL